MITTLRQGAPEKKIIVEAETITDALAALRGKPDILQLDKFSPEQIIAVMDQAKGIAPDCSLSVTGGVNKNTVVQFAKTGVTLLVTSSPYYAAPADIKVSLQPA